MKEPFTLLSERIHELREPCKFPGHMSGDECAEKGCPGYTVLSGIEAEMVLREWLMKNADQWEQRVIKFRDEVKP